MCMSLFGGGSPNIPAPIKYAAVKTPQRSTTGQSDLDAQRRRAAAAAASGQTGGSTTGAATTEAKTLLGV